MDDTLALSLVTFFAGRPQEEALGRAVTQQLLKELPGIAVQVQKSQITFRGDRPISWTVDGEFGGEFEESRVVNRRRALKIIQGT